MLNITRIPRTIRQDAFHEESKPIVIHVRNFNERAVEEFRRDFGRAVQNEQPLIPICIDSFGGQIYALNAMLSMVKTSPVPVATFTEGKAMSCGAFLLGFGTPGYRFISPRATVMLHEVSSGAFGTVSHIKADVGEAGRLNDTLFQELALHCGRKEDYFLKKIHGNNHADLFFDAETARKSKLIDHVGYPHLVTQVSYQMDIQIAGEGNDEDEDEDDE